MSKDFTFSDKDIIRIICNHLTETERTNLLNFLYQNKEYCKKYDYINDDDIQQLISEIPTVTEPTITEPTINNDNNLSDEDLEKLTFTLFDKIKENIDILLTNPLAFIPPEVLENLPDNMVLTLNDLLTLEDSTKETISKILEMILDLLGWLFVALGLVVAFLDYIALAIKSLDWLRNTWIFRRPGIRQALDFIFDNYLNNLNEKISHIKDYIRLVKLAIIEILEEVLLLLQNSIK